MSSTPMTEEQRQETLKSLGLNPDAPGLAAAPAKVAVAPIAPQATPDVDEHIRRTTPAADLVFDPSLLDAFPVLDGSGMAAASRYLFDLYKSPHKDKERHGLLHRRISEFIQQVRRERATGGLVKEKVKATKEQRELAALIAAQGLTAEDLSALLISKEA